MELIKREAALDALLHEMCMTGYQSRAMDAIRFLPTIDAAPVVRCKDCQYFRPDETNGETCVNISGMIEPSEDDYCSRWLARMDGGDGYGTD